jgi:hypothetical protein
MKPLHLLLLLALFCAGCTDVRERAEEQLRQQSPELLRKEAAMLYKEKFSSHGNEYLVIRPVEWPASFKAFAPTRVGAYLDGITLTIQTKDRLESGLYIVPQSMDYTPRDTPRAVFRKMADGIYWYSFGD